MALYSGTCYRRRIDWVYLIHIQGQSENEKTQLMLKPYNSGKAAPAAFFDRIPLTSQLCWIIVFLKGVISVWKD